MARNQVARPGTGVRGQPTGLRFFGEVVSELRKVTWPSRQETTRLTMLVLVVSVIIGAILGVIDIGFSRMFAALGGG